jgi:hypothetical protein
MQQKQQQQQCQQGFTPEAKRVQTLVETQQQQSKQ